ncbi:mycothiol transferase [Nocardioides pyridinolyticus]
MWGFLGEQVEAPWGDWTVDEPWDSELGGRWHVPEEVTVGELVAGLRAVGERTRAVLRDFPLDATASPGGRFAADPPTLEWICFHVLAEYARHAGHLDIVVELGTTP